ncbi:hypothetical protein LY78DRAFT_490834 [Colletotrichum sublineola]|nr:hypothetical protein LY78DRAFT_490834 [Colletotrichum sublineola]
MRRSFASWPSQWVEEAMVADVQLCRCRRRIEVHPLGQRVSIACFLVCLLAMLSDKLGKFVAGECCAECGVETEACRWQLFRSATLVCIVGEDATYQNNSTQRLIAPVLFLRRLHGCPAPPFSFAFPRLLSPLSSSSSSFFFLRLSHPSLDKKQIEITKPCFLLSST